MTICNAEAAAIVGSPPHWISEKMCIGQVVVTPGPDRKSDKLMSLNEMMNAKIAPEIRLARSCGMSDFEESLNSART